METKLRITLTQQKGDKEPIGTDYDVDETIYSAIGEILDRLEYLESKSK